MRAKVVLLIASTIWTILRPAKCSQISSDGFVVWNRTVQVITSRLRYDAPDHWLAPHERLKRLLRSSGVPTSGFGRGNLAWRAFDYISFCLSAGRAPSWVMRCGDVVVAKNRSAHVVGHSGAHRLAAAAVNWLQDIFPGCRCTQRRFCAWAMERIWSTGQIFTRRFIRWRPSECGARPADRGTRRSLRRCVGANSHYSRLGGRPAVSANSATPQPTSPPLAADSS